MASESWKSVVRVETTVAATFEREAGLRKRAVFLKGDREIDSDETWMFSDGSSKGWSGLVVLRPGQEVRLWAREAGVALRNVGAEMDAVSMALEAALPGERIALVADFLWSIYYVMGWHNVENPLLREQVAAAQAVLAAKTPGSLRFIHVKGHLKDRTGLGRWNGVADQLCSLGKAVDRTIPLTAFDEAGGRVRTLAAVLGQQGQ